MRPQPSLRPLPFVVAVCAALCLPIVGLAEPNPMPPPSAVGVTREPGHPGALMSPQQSVVDPGLYLDKAWTGWGNLGNQLEPPDCAGAAGPLGILEINNRRIQYLRKDGSPFWSSDHTFWLSYQWPGRLIDPRALYDPHLRRFIVTMIQTHTFVDPLPIKGYLLLAVSKSEHPVTSGADDWWFYRMDVTQVAGPASYGLDYPGLGYDDDAIYASGNMFEYPVFGGNFRNVMVVRIDKNQAANGVLSWSIAQTAPTHDLADAFTLQPATVIGATDPGDVAYLCEVPYDGPTDRIRLWALLDSLGTPTLRDTLIAVPSWGGAIALAPQCVSGTVRTWSPTAQGNAFWRDGSLWFCHTAVVAGRTVIRWYRIETHGWPAGAAQLGESGTLDPGTGLWAYQPAIGGTALGDVAIVFTQSGTTQCPTPMYSAYRAGSGGFTTPLPLASQPPSSTWDTSWGDYGTVTEDPVDHGLWISHELHLNRALGDWTPQWGHLRFDDDLPGWPDSGRVVRGGQVEARNAVVVPSLAGGAITVWRELDAVYAQRLDADGSRAAGWPERGVKVCPGPADQIQACSDSAGGVYVTWMTYFGASVVRVDAQGAHAAGWPADGIPLGQPGEIPQIAGTAAGVLVAWTDGGVIVQRISPSGERLWGLDGITLDAEGWRPVVTPDASGGALVAWAPGRAQRVSSAGIMLWPGPVDLVAEGEAPRAVADGAGGMIAVFQTVGGDGLTDLVAQRVTGDGSLASGWPAAGAALCTWNGGQSEVALAADGAGGLFAAWRDQRSLATLRSDIYAARLTPGGQLAPGWTPDGVAVCSLPGHQFAPAIALDAADGVRIVWQDHRAMPTCLNGPCNTDVYLQRLLPDGTHDPLLPAQGMPVSDAVGNQTLPGIASLGGGRTLIVWNDGRQAPDCVPWCTMKVMARLLQDATGVPPGVLHAPATALELAAPQPNPVLRDAGRATLSFRIAETLGNAPMRLEVYDLTGRRVRSLASGPARTGAQQASWDLRDSDGRTVRTGLYFVRLRVGANQVTRNLMVW